MGFPWFYFFFLFLQTALHSQLEHFETQKMFILVSTVMSRTKAKPQFSVSLWKTNK